MTAQEFITKTMGKPWVNRATGSDAYDCWGLVIASFQQIDDIQLPSIEGYIQAKTKTHRAASTEIVKPWWVLSENQQGNDGDVVAYFDYKGRFTHVGRVLCGGVLHSSGESGVGGVKWERKHIVSMRFHRTEYRRYANNSTL